MHTKTYQVFTHKDFDGAVSLLVFLWARSKSPVHFQELNNLNVTEKLNQYANNTANPFPTLVLDFALRPEFKNCDQSHFTFIDHHKSSENYLNTFKNCKVLYKEFSSNARWMYKLFEKDLTHLTQSQKYLIALADDFDCYKLQLPHSYDLNILFWSEYRQEFGRFIKDFKEGFKNFSSSQIKRIESIKKAAKAEAQKIQKFEGTIKIGDTNKYTVAALTDNTTNLVMDEIINEYNPELFFFINTKSEKVSLRQSRNNPIDLGAFAEKICEGGGHFHSAGGKITPLFLEITKNLKPL
jgi:oligoribonuclease NrnB/cAMP/cGMP phosphodiesterase (DHH superfamily)